MKAVEDAKRLFARGDFTGAKSRCELALALSPGNLEALYTLGNCFRKLGRLDEAVSCLERALLRNPRASDVAYALGLTHLRRGDFHQAVSLFDQALAHNGQLHDANFNKGIALAQLGRYQEALACFNAVLAANPGSALVLYNQGEALGRLGRHEQELECYDEALALEPDSPELLANHGAALIELKRHEQALRSLDRALALQPNLSQAHHNRSLALRGLRRYEEALASCERALMIAPGSSEFLTHRGLLLGQLGRHADALRSHDAALSAKPHYPEALVNRGMVLRDMRRLEAALQSYERALAIRPGYVEALNNKGIVLGDLRRFEQAVESLQLALSLQPQNAVALNNLASTHFEAGQYEEAAHYFARLIEVDHDYPYALGSLIHSRMHVCDWTDFEKNLNSLLVQLHAGRKCAHPFQMLVLSDNPADHLLAANIYRSDITPKLAPPTWTRRSHTKIRVAYISADFHEHATSYLMAGLLEHHNKKEFEITALSFGPDDGSFVRARIQASVDRFVDASHMSDQAIAELIRSIEIDIAVDLKGYTKDSRPGILALRPAPVQVSYLGYPGTMGADFIDYIIADSTVIPESDHVYYSEKVVYLPNTYQATDSQRPVAAPMPQRADVGLPVEGFVFCSFNSPQKITPAMFDLWMQLLREADGSVLWLLEGTHSQVHNLRREARNCGVDESRLVFAPRLTSPEHLSRLRLADLCLDNLPYGAHTTASDALWVGVPIVTCVGRSFASRVAASLLGAIGVPELTVQSLDEYNLLALSLARDRSKLSVIKGRLASHRDSQPLFNTAQFTQNMETVYGLIWKRHLQHE